MYGDLIYLSNQAEICALQEREFRRVLRSEMWWFDTLKSTFDSSSNCCWKTLMERLGLIQQSLARFGDLMLWRVPLICLQSVVEELLWGVLNWSNRASFFVDFKRRWRRLENSLRELPCLKRERERELPCLQSLSWRKFVSLRIPLAIWCFEEYLWFVFKVLLNNSNGAFRLDATELRSL
jgi:hypothetical protein